MTLRHTLSKKYSQISAIALPLFRKRRGGNAYVKAMTAHPDPAIASTAEESARIVGIVKQSRQTADQAYDKLVETVNTLVVVEGETSYATFIDHMNTLIDRQKTVLKSRSTLNEKKDGQAATE